MPRPPMVLIEWPEGDTRSTWERFEAVLRHIVSVPKAEIDRRLAADRLERRAEVAARVARRRGHDLAPFVRQGDEWVSSCLRLGCGRAARVSATGRDGSAFVGRCRGVVA